MILNNIPLLDRLSICLNIMCVFRSQGQDLVLSISPYKTSLYIILNHPEAIYLYLNSNKKGGAERNLFKKGGKAYKGGSFLEKI